MAYLGRVPSAVPVTADDIPDNSITAAKILDNVITIDDIGPDAVGVSELSATGTASSSTFLRGDNSWVTPTNTTYSIQDGELSEISFTSADNTKLDAISGTNTGDQTITLTGDVTGSGTGSFASTIKDNVALGGDPTTTTQSASDNSTKIATTAYTDAQVATVVDSAPGTLNTLNELAAALGDDANFSTTTATNIAAKLPLAGGTMTGDLNLGDNVDINFGGSADLKIYHDASHSYITDTGTGNLKLTSGGTAVSIEKSDGENMAIFRTDGAVDLYHDNVKKFETTSTGIDVTGSVIADTLVGGSSNFDIKQNTSDGSDNQRTRIGGGGDVVNSRGAFIELHGNEHTSTGKAVINAGNVTGGEISLRTGGSEKVVVDKDGKVGINVDSPTQKLDVSGHVLFGNGRTNNSEKHSKLTAINYANSSVNPIGVIYANGHSSGNFIRYGGGTDSISPVSTHSFYTATGTPATGEGTQRMCIDSSGNVGIGTDLPDTLLHVNGQAKFENNVTLNENTPALVVPNGDLRIFTGGSEKMRIDSSGNVGIGEIDPQSILHLKETANDIVGAKLILDNPHTGNADYGSTIEYRAGTGASGTTDTNIGRITCYKKDNTSGSVLRFQTQQGDFSGLSTSMHIDEDGNVGIGTDDPQTGTNQTSLTINAISYPDLSFEYGGTLAGNVSANSGGVHMQARGSRKLRFVTNDEDRMTIDSSGNVGIGISTPNEAGYQSGSRVLSIQGDAADDFGVLELLNTNATSANRLGEVTFGNMDGGGSVVCSSRVRARRDGADNSSDLSLWTTSTGTLTERLTIDSTGNVGIGTSSPSNNHANANKLVVGDGTSGGIANYMGTGTGWYAFSRDNANNSDAFDGGISYDVSRNLKFHTNAGTTRMLIDGSGNTEFFGNVKVNGVITHKNLMAAHMYGSSSDQSKTQLLITHHTSGDATCGTRHHKLRWVAGSTGIPYFKFYDGTAHGDAGWSANWDFSTTGTEVMGISTISGEETVLVCTDFWTLVYNSTNKNFEGINGTAMLSPNHHVIMYFEYNQAICVAPGSEMFIDASSNLNITPNPHQ